MNEMKHYFSLKFKGSNAFHQNGKQLKLTERVVNIGETADCDVCYQVNGEQPEYYASIIQNEDGKSWRIVKRSTNVEISIAGQGIIGYASQLADGDIIQFAGQQMGLCFHAHYDNRYDEEEHDNAWRWVIISVLGLMTIIALAIGISKRQVEIRNEDVEPLEESICLIKVDSVRRILSVKDNDAWLPPTKVLMEEAPTGTAFLTTDGKLITARHCVEYWIGTHLELTTRIDDLEKDDILRWAIEAETFNQTHEADSSMQIQVFFSIYDCMGNKKYGFASTDEQVHFNRDKDGIFLLADFDQDYYWRTIRPYYTNREMELGDILWIDILPERGSIKMASEEQIKDIKIGRKLMVCGYPMTGFGDKRMVFTEGSIRRDFSVDCENLVFEGNINHGFSGGPVLTKAGGDIVAIGVVSRVDSISSGVYKWAVPTTQLMIKNDD